MKCYAIMTYGAIQSKTNLLPSDFETWCSCEIFSTAHFLDL